MVNLLEIGIDGRPANERNRVGIGNYCYGLLRALVDLKADVKYRIYLDCHPIDTFPLRDNEADIRILPACRWWTQRSLARELRRDPPDVFFSSGIQVPAFCPCPRVATVLDLAYITFGSHFTPRTRVMSRFYTYLSFRLVEHLLAISEATRTDIVRLSRFRPERITVAYLGSSGMFRPDLPPDYLARVRHELDLPERYVLYVGTLQPRKNLVRLMDAFSGLRQAHPDLPHHLIIAGGQGWMYDSILEAARRSPVRDRVRLLGFVPDEALPALIHEADVLTLVSLWEGFGLPVVEAMACGTAVLVSDCSSLPEVAGDAGVLVNPLDTQEICSGLERLLLDDAFRTDLESRGLAQAAKFTWENTARIVLGTLKQVALNARTVDHSIGAM